LVFDGKGDKFTVFRNMMLRRIFGFKREEGTLA
jgi:hypothetical protein